MDIPNFHGDLFSWKFQSREYIAHEIKYVYSKLDL